MTLDRGIGDNGGPALDDELLPPPPQGARCGKCVHWKPPSAQEVRWYEQRGNRRVKEPSGYCHTVNLTRKPLKVLWSGARMDRTLACVNFVENPERARFEPGVGQGWVTIYEGNRIVWQGREGTEPAEYRHEQTELDL